MAEDSLKKYKELVFEHNKLIKKYNDLLNMLKDHNKSTEEFNNGWKLWESGSKLPVKHSSSVADGYRSRGYIDLNKKIVDYEKIIEDFLAKDSKDIISKVTSSEEMISLKNDILEKNDKIKYMEECILSIESTQKEMLEYANELAKELSDKESIIRNKDSIISQFTDKFSLYKEALGLFLNKSSILVMVSRMKEKGLPEDKIADYLGLQESTVKFLIGMTEK